MRRFYDIQLQKMSWPWNRGQWSLKVIESGTIWKIVYGFLLVFFSNIVHKMHRFWDIRLQNWHDLENREVRQGRWKCHHAIERIWLPIDIL